MGEKSKTVDPVRDLEAVRQFLSGPGPSAIFDVPWMPIYLGIVYLFHPILGLVATGGAILICVLIGLNEMTSRKPAAEASQHAVKRTTMVEQGRRNAEAIRAMGMVGHWSGDYTGRHDCCLYYDIARLRPLNRPLATGVVLSQPDKA